MLSFAQAQAQDTAHDWRIMAFGAVWAETNLPELPYNVFTGNLEFCNTGFVGLEASRVLVRDFDIPLGVATLSGNDIELSMQVLKHWGHQKHVELAGALVWRSGDWWFSRAMGVNLATGFGLSHALKNPKYEKGPGGVRGVDMRQFQFHILSELEFTLAEAPDWHLVFRLQHRSGIWGVISPRKTGSNYLGMGIRKDF